MALKKNLLLESLDNLRDDIRKTHLALTNQIIDVCTDDALKEMADKLPLKISDFHAISGLDKDFHQLYANRFLDVIKTHQNTSVRSVKVSRSANKVLHHYKDRLTNISKSNPNLYLGRIEQIHSFDLTDIENKGDILEFLTNNRVKNLKLGVKADHKETHITKLYREVNKTFRETGSYNLYITYPYIEGIFQKDKFPVKAPLLYFPVKIERTLRTFTIKKDTERDIIFNRDLMLASSKMERSNIDSNMPALDVFNKKVLLETVIPFYEKHGIKIEYSDLNDDFLPFKNELKDDFVKTARKVFKLKPYVTLSRFKLYSSSIQKDMETILASHKYNELLEGLIDESSLFLDEKQITYHISSDPIDEQKLSYINDLNYAQEKVIELINSEKKIVIWGPPGTGKSQTITSLIASSVLKGENVLVVSEKKVALDVIYSRLKRASKYAMFIDDAENKQDFYEKLKKFLEPEPPVRTLNNDVYHLEQEIKDLLNDMDKSLNLLYQRSIEEVPIHTLFERYIKDKDILPDLTPKHIHQMFKDEFSAPSFSMIERLEKTFDSDLDLKRYLDLAAVLLKYPWTLKLESKISRSSKLELNQFNQELLAVTEKIKHSGFFKRRKLKHDFLNDYSSKLLFLTKKKSLDMKYLKLLFKDSSLHQYITENINQLDKQFYKYLQLSSLDKKYLNMLLTNRVLKEQPEIYKYRKYIFDAFYSGYLEVFLANNQKHLYIIDNYKNKLNELKQIMDDKMHVSTESFEMELYRHALSLSNTKRIMDIKRIFESTHKPSIKTFIDTFQLEMSNHVRLWMMTPEVVSAVMPLHYGMFDLVIFDEASQMYVEKGIPAIYRAKKVVIAGDPKQLRPSSLGLGRIDDEDELFEDDVLKDVSLDAKSLLDLARYRFKEALLNYHYRSQYEELIAFSNHAFYDAKLIVSPNQTDSPKPPIEYVYVAGGTFDNRKNLKEAKTVVEIVKKIFKERKNNESIGIITFNSSQRDAIENLIDQQLFTKGVYQKQFEKELFRKNDNEDTSLFVKNIENVQGDERDIIIFSMGYAKDKTGRVMRRFGWLNHEGGQNRLNVAVTRAKKKIYFVSSLYPEEFKVDDLISTGPKLLKDFMRYCYFVSGKNYEMAKEVLNQLYTNETQTKTALSNIMVKDIKQRLERNGYAVEESIGIGRYKISLGVKDPKTKSYMLGIICDTQSDTLNARRDLLHQEKYLKSRNWQIYRVFESNWYTNPNRELKNIRDMLKTP